MGLETRLGRPRLEGVEIMRSIPATGRANSVPYAVSDLYLGPLYNMAQQGVMPGRYGEPIDVVIADGNPQNDGHLTPAQRYAVNLIRHDYGNFKEEYMPDMQDWLANDSHYKGLLRHDPDREQLFIIANGKGTSLEQAIMFATKAEAKTIDGRVIGVDVLGRSLHYRKLINNMKRQYMGEIDNDILHEAATTYVMKHEHIHLLSEDRMLRQHEGYVEADTDQAVSREALYNAQKYEKQGREAESEEERQQHNRKARIYHAIHKMASDRVEAIKQAGYEPRH